MAGSGPFARDEKCREFVGNLARVREKFGWSQARLAAECHFSTGVIANIECFVRAPTVDQGQAFDEAFGLADVFAGKAVVIREGASFSPGFRSFAEFEATATDLFVAEHSFVPGPFQTERYARAVLKKYPDVSAAVVEERLTARLSRQDILTREEPEPPRVWTLLDESVLRRRIGDASVMREQHARLLELADLPKVRIQVIEGLGEHAGLLGAFTIAEGPGRASILSMDDISGGRVHHDPAVVNEARLAFRAMQTEALSARASRDLIASLLEEPWQDTATDGVRAPTAAPTGASA